MRQTHINKEINTLSHKTIKAWECACWLASVSESDSFRRFAESENFEEDVVWIAKSRHSFAPIRSDPLRRRRREANSIERDADVLAVQ